MTRELIVTTSTARPHENSRPTASDADRWELVRALGAVLTTPPPANAHLREALDLPPESAVDHTDAFVLSLPPHAAIYLGPEGKLGGDGLDRVGGFWRALGLSAPEDADHLGVLLLLYAELGVAESTKTDERGRAQMRRARTALFCEHIASWAPGYLTAISGLGIAPVTDWAQLLGAALRAEAADLELPDTLPSALREAPPALAATDSVDAVLDAIVSPIRSGIIVTQQDLAAGARLVGVGFRRGERRFALKAMLQQDPLGTLTWLAAQARSWGDLHEAASWPTATAKADAAPKIWWASRARHSAEVLETLGASADPPTAQPPYSGTEQ